MQALARDLPVHHVWWSGSTLDCCGFTSHQQVAFSMHISRLAIRLRQHCLKPASESRSVGAVPRILMELRLILALLCPGSRRPPTPDTFYFLHFSLSLFPSRVWDRRTWPGITLPGFCTTTLFHSSVTSFGALHLSTSRNIHHLATTRLDG
jgi:hypothetical protein